MSCHSCGIIPPFLLVSIRDHVAANPDFYEELVTESASGEEEFSYDRKAYFNYWNTSVPIKFKLPEHPNDLEDKRKKELENAKGNQVAAPVEARAPQHTSNDGKQEKDEDKQERAMGTSALGAAAGAGRQIEYDSDDEDHSPSDNARGILFGSWGGAGTAQAPSESLLSHLQRPSWFMDEDLAAQRRKSANNALGGTAAIPGTVVAGAAGALGGTIGGAMIGGMYGMAYPFMKAMDFGKKTESAPLMAGALLLAVPASGAGAVAGIIGGAVAGGAKGGQKAATATGTAGLGAAKTVSVLSSSYFAKGEFAHFSSDPFCQQIIICDASSKRNYEDNISHESPFPRTLAGIQARSNDLSATRIYQAIERTLAFLALRFDRNSIDDKGQMIIASIHYPREDGHRKLSNAYWTAGKQQMLIGDGDGLILNELGLDLATIAHETIHGMTRHAIRPTGLRYRNQSGALDEHISDVFAIMVKNNHLWESHSSAIDDDPIWYFGANLVQQTYKRLLAQKFTGQFFHGLRSMKNPGSAYNLGAPLTERTGLAARDPQVSEMRHYVHTTADQGGVHINSGIPNKAFYLFATNIGEKALKTAGKVWYATITSGRLQPNAKFIDFANETLRNVKPKHAEALRAAWERVGIIVLQG